MGNDVTTRPSGGPESPSLVAGALNHECCVIYGNSLLLTGKTVTSGDDVAAKEQRVSANELSPNRIHTDKSHPLHYWSWRRKSTTACGA